MSVYQNLDCVAGLSARVDFILGRCRCLRNYIYLVSFCSDYRKIKGRLHNVNGTHAGAVEEAMIIP